MRKFFLIWAIPLLFPVMAHATIERGSLSLSAGAGGTVNTSSGMSHFNYDNLFGGGVDENNRNTPVPFHAKGKADFVSKLNADYFQPIQEKILAGLGLSYFFETHRTLKSTPYPFATVANRGDVPKDYVAKVKIDPKGHFAISIKPAYQIHKKVLIYTLFSYHHMKANIFTTSSLDPSNLTNGILRITDVSDRRSFNGLGFGGGVKYKFFRNWFIDIAAEWVKFQRKKITGPSFTSNLDEVTVMQNIKVQPSWVDITSSVGYEFG